MGNPRLTAGVPPLGREMKGVFSGARQGEEQRPGWTQLFLMSWRALALGGPWWSQDTTLAGQTE